MYYTLFHAMTDAIALLQKAQQEAEEIYLSEETFGELSVLSGEDDGQNNTDKAKTANE